MLLLTLATVTLAATLGATPHSTLPSDTAAVGDTATLTADVIRNMTTFWESFLHEPDSVRDAGRDTANREPFSYTSEVSGAAKSTKVASVVSIRAMAARFPSVAQDLQHANLTADQWEQYRVALAGARVSQLTNSATHSRASSKTPSPAVAALRRNVGVLRANTKDVEALIGSGMWLPSVTTTAEVGRPAPQFAVRTWLNAQNDTRTTFGDGHGYIVFFTAKWCGPCQMVYPVVAKLMKTASDHGVRILYVTGAFEGDGTQLDLSSPAQVQDYRDYFGHHEVTTPVAIFVSPTQMVHSGYFEQTSINLPTLAVVDGSGKLRDLMRGWEADEFPSRLAADVKKVQTQ